MSRVNHPLAMVKTPPHSTERPSAASLCAPIPGAVQELAIREPEPSRLLSALVAEDPLGLRQRSAARVRAHCLLLDADRVSERAAARVVYMAASAGAASSAPPATGGLDSPANGALDSTANGGLDSTANGALEHEASEEGLAAWLTDRIDEAIVDCLSIDERGADLDAQRLACDALEDHRLFADAFGAGQAHARRASVHFHRLAPLQRRTLIELLLERRPIEEFLAGGRRGLTALRADLERALDAACGDEARREDEQRHEMQEESA